MSSSSIEFPVTFCFLTPPANTKQFCSYFESLFSLIKSSIFNLPTEGSCLKSAMTLWYLIDWGKKIKSKLLKTAIFLKVSIIHSLSGNALESKLDRWLEFNKNNFEVYWDWVITCLCCLQPARLFFIGNRKLKLQILPTGWNSAALQGPSVVTASCLQDLLQGFGEVLWWLRFHIGRIDYILSLRS